MEIPFYGNWAEKSTFKIQIQYHDTPELHRQYGPENSPIAG